MLLRIGRLARLEQALGQIGVGRRGIEWTEREHHLEFPRRRIGIVALHCQTAKDGVGLGIERIDGGQCAR